MFKLSGAAMKSVVCFGNSNTWGYIPGSNGKRYPFEKRWTSVLEEKLGNGFNIIPEGLNGRTAVFDDPVTGNKSGLKHLDIILTSHYPIDLLVIMLGTNDLKDRFNIPPVCIAKAVGRLIEYAEKSSAGINGNPPEILLVCPPPILEAPVYREEFLEGVKKSQNLKEEYKKLAESHCIPLFCAGDCIASSPVDGIHWTEESHKIFGSEIALTVEKLV